MLWYKAWLETRSTRFLTSSDSHALQRHLRPSCSRTHSSGMEVGFQPSVVCKSAIPRHHVGLSVVLLGMGGIVREKANGTSSATLALPVSRARLLRVRFGMGALEAIVLGVVPWLAVFVVSSFARKPILITQVASYVLLSVAGGLVYFAMAVLVSSLVSGEYTAPALAFGIVLLAAMLFDAWLRQFNLWRLVTGDFSIDRSTYLLSEHLPWMGILSSLSVAVLMLLASTIVVQRREF